MKQLHLLYAATFIFGKNSFSTVKSAIYVYHPIKKENANTKYTENMSQCTVVILSKEPEARCIFKYHIGHHIDLLFVSYLLNCMYFSIKTGSHAKMF